MSALQFMKSDLPMIASITSGLTSAAIFFIASTYKKLYSQFHYTYILQWSATNSVIFIVAPMIIKKGLIQTELSMILIFLICFNWIILILMALDVLLAAGFPAASLKLRTGNPETIFAATFVICLLLFLFVSFTAGIYLSSLLAVFIFASTVCLVIIGVYFLQRNCNKSETKLPLILVGLSIVCWTVILFPFYFDVHTLPQEDLFWISTIWNVALFGHTLVFFIIYACDDDFRDCTKFACKFQLSENENEATNNELENDCKKEVI